jgi:ferritin-like protein
MMGVREGSASPRVDPGVLVEVEAARAAERSQTRFYRALALEAGLAGDAAGEERLNELHADEQHHLARLTARLLELGVTPAPLEDADPGATVPWPAWEGEARRREQAEVSRYERLVAEGGLDPLTLEIAREILATEKLHARNLGGKWVPAAPGGGVE